MRVPGSCRTIALVMVCVLAWVTLGGEVCAAERFANSIGMDLVSIEPGAFLMGSETSEDRWDERPAHKVTITEPLYMSVTEVTVEQFKQFRPDYSGSEIHAPYATAVSWYDAVAFCQWLSEKEGKPYRLPTEAEWEYACRAGTTTPFFSGDDRSEMDKPNPWGLKNMHTGPREWCLDWHGEYPLGDQTDPVGPEYGVSKVVRGGGLDVDDDDYARSASRAGIAPSFGPFAYAKAEERLEEDTNFEPGLVGTWFGEDDLSNPKDPDSLDRVDKDWGSEHGNTWSVRWYGHIVAPATGEVTFTVEVDNGMLLEIIGQTVIAGWDENAAWTGTFAMEKGARYPMTLSYYKDGGDAYLRLYWSRQGKDRELVPADALCHNESDGQRAAKDGGRGKSAPGMHSIGFRVVQAPMPKTRPLAYQPPFVRQCVKQNVDVAKLGPGTNKPYFRKRYLLPTPPENCSREVIDAAGLHPSFRGHNHSPALEVCPNGDVLMVIYTSYDEYEPGVSLMATRLRFGAEEWDMPSPMFDLPGVNDHAPLLWKDDGPLHFFWGNPRLEAAFPFQWTSSTDSGATWSEIRFPNFKNEIGPHSKQPINTALRDRSDTMYIASDGEGGTSVLWASHDDGKAWYDTVGRSAGRHTTYVLLKDGSILGMGGKNTDIDGFMPKAVSSDGGKTWTVSKTPFPALGSNQRPSVLRLASGRLFFAGDFQHIDGQQPEGVTERGSYVALSEDEGETWHIKELIGTLPHENPSRHGGADTIGYSAARQAPNGLIHLITTMNRPCLHFAFNEAWILDKEMDDRSDAELMEPSATTISNVRDYEQEYPGGKATWSAGMGDNGCYLLHGAETWHYENGQKQREVTYRLGRKVGQESYWNQDGKKLWGWHHRDDGTSVWTQWWPNGKKKAESTWRNLTCDGIAKRWDPAGNAISSVEFVKGAHK